MAASKVVCPHCQTILRCSKPVPAGKQITCVKCRNPFLVTAAMLQSSTGQFHGGEFLAASKPGAGPSPLAGGSHPQSVSAAPLAPAANSPSSALQGPHAFAAAAPFFETEDGPLVVVRRPRKSYAGLVAGLTILLLLGGGAAAAWWYFFNQNKAAKPEEVDAVKKPKDIEKPKNIAKLPPKEIPPPEKKKIPDVKLKQDKKPILPKVDPPKKDPKEIIDDSKKPKVDPVLEIEKIKVGQVDQKMIDAAIDKGVRFLQGKITPAGNWPGTLEEHPVGYAALPALALVECQVPPDHPSVKKAADYVRRHAPKPIKTYDLGLCVVLLDRLGDPADKPLIRNLAMRLVAGQTPAGGWTYDCPVLSDGETKQLLNFMQVNRPKIDFLNPIQGKSLPPEKGRIHPPPQVKKGPAKGLDTLPGRLNNLPVVVHKRGKSKLLQLQGVKDDNSNTQFGLLGLWAARRHDVPTELSLELAAQRFRQAQNGDGGWGYVLKQPTKNTMTCVGLLSLAMGHGAAAEAFVEARAKGQIPPSPPREDPFIKTALQSLGDYIDGEDKEKRGLETRIDLYYLWTLERAGLLYQSKHFGKRDWYRFGAAIIVDKQNPDGGWQLHYDPPIDTSFALLFLKRSNLVGDLSDKLQFFIAIPKTDSGPRKR